MKRRYRRCISHVQTPAKLLFLTAEHQNVRKSIQYCHGSCKLVRNLRRKGLQRNIHTKVHKEYSDLIKYFFPSCKETRLKIFSIISICRPFEYGKLYIIGAYLLDMLVTICIIHSAPYACRHSALHSLN
jgi:hypothetical protein